jgi:3-oxoadipate enol-lactonase
MGPMSIQTGIIESATTVPLAAALARWRREAEAGVCDTGRYRCRFFAWGHGQPLLFIHGMSDRARSFVPVAAHLTDQFRCIAFDLPTGYRDGARLGRIVHADLVENVFILLDHLKVGQTCLYGASFGGTVALGALHADPKRFLRAALQSSFARRKLAPAERAIAGLARYWPGRMRDLPLRRRHQQKVDAPAFAAAPPEIWAFQKANTASMPIKAFAHRAWLISRLDLRPLLPSIPHPILLLSGDRDSIIGQKCVEELAAGLPHADRLEFHDCGHYAQYTHAAGVAEALRRFLLPPCGLT